jgi:hypothetical protein
MKYYLKKISKQDKTRTFVINSQAITHFFRLTNIKKRDDEDSIQIIYPNEKSPQKIKIIIKQDPRLYIDRGYFNIDDIILFKKRWNNERDLFFYEIFIFKANDDRYRDLSMHLKNNFLISDKLLFDKELDSNSSENEKPIKITIDARKK